MFRCYACICKPTYMSAHIHLEQFLQDENGQDIIEYALILAFMALGTLLSMKSLATSVGALFANIGTQLTSPF